MLFCLGALQPVRAQYDLDSLVQLYIVADEAARHHLYFDVGLDWSLPNAQDVVERAEARVIELEAAAFRRLTEHLRNRTDVQNIDLMNLAGFCRNCLSNWYADAARDSGNDMSKDEAREIVYGMPYADWKAKYQTEASADQKAQYESSKPKGH